jgi:hypothetical protein
MRLTIAAGLIMGVALATQSALGAHTRAKVGHAAGAGRVHESAPWYIAMNVGHRAGTRGANTRRLSEADAIEFS